MKTENLDVLVRKGKKLSVKEKLLPVLVLAAIIISLIMVVKPQVSAVYENRTSLEKKQKEVKDLEAKNQFLTQLNSSVDLEILKRQLDETGQYLPTYKPVLEILTSIIRLSRYEEVDFYGLSLTPGKVKEAGKDSTASATVGSDDVDTLEILFTINGEKKKLLDFITKMKEVAPLMKPEKFTIARSAGTESDDTSKTLNISVTTKIYFQKGLPPKPTVTSEIATMSEEEKEFLKTLEGYLFLKPEFNTDPETILDLGVENPFAEDQPE